MAQDVVTKHLVFDLETGRAYGLSLDQESKCRQAQVLNLVVETQDGRTVQRFDADDGGIPFGQTTYAVEMNEESEEKKKGMVFTITWPTADAASHGAKPEVLRKEMPADLGKSGFAAQPKVQRGVGVEDENALKQALGNIDDMIGLKNAKRDIRQNISLARFNRVKEKMKISTKPISRHMVFTGSPGTGKTTFAREVAKVYHALGFIDKPEVYEVKREDLVAGYVGQTALKTKEQIEKAKGGILFIDEAYALSRAAAADGNTNDFGREAIDTLVAAMENMRDDLIVIVAGYPGPMKKFIDANEGLKDRFMTYIQFDDYSMPELGDIMDFIAKDRGYAMTPEAKTYALALVDEEKRASGKNFANGRTVRNLVEKAEKALAERLDEQGVLGKGHGLTKDARRTLLTTITLDDVKSINLQGLSEKKTVTIGFGSKEDTPDTPKNDNAETPPPQVQTTARKPSIRAHFKM